MSFLTCCSILFTSCWLTSPAPTILSLNPVMGSLLCLTSYRSRDEVQEVRQSRAPITGFRDRIVGAGLVSQQEVKRIEQQVKKDIDADTKKAREDGEIGAEELCWDMYQENLQGKIRGVSPWELHEHKNTQKAINI